MPELHSSLQFLPANLPEKSIKFHGNNVAEAARSFYGLNLQLPGNGQYQIWMEAGKLHIASTIGISRFKAPQDWDVEHHPTGPVLQADIGGRNVAVQLHIQAVEAQPKSMSLPLKLLPIAEKVLKYRELAAKQKAGYAPEEAEQQLLDIEDARALLAEINEVYRAPASSKPEPSSTPARKPPASRQPQARPRPAPPPMPTPSPSPSWGGSSSSYSRSSG